MSSILTIDLGTTLLKFAVFDGQGAMRALARISPPVEHPRAGEWEMNSDRFREAIREGIAQLGRHVDLRQVEAISFATQANSFVLLEADDTPLTPIILWPDERARELDGLMERISAPPGFRSHTGIPRMSFQFAAAKMLHLKRHRPELFRNSPRFLFISDLLSYWFAGKHVSEAGMAGLCGAVDIQRIDWRNDALPQMGLDGVKLPQIVRAGTDLGMILPGVAEEFALPRTCRFVVGCLDQYAGAIGTGSVVPGTLSETTGTVLAAVRHTGDLRAHAPADVFAGPSFDPGGFFEMSFSSTSANLLEHYRNTLPDRPAYETLSDLAEHAETGDLRIEPYVEGEPIERCFCNVTPDHSRGQVVRAIMLCVARQLDMQVRSLCGGVMPKKITSAGGAARSRVWQQIKADVLQVPFVTTSCDEPTSLGAAILGASAIQARAIPALAAEWVHTRPAVNPS